MRAVPLSGAVLLVLAGAIAGSCPAFGQWSAVTLHPGDVGATHSIAWAAGDGLQAGRISIDPGWTHAGLWTGSAASWVDVHPAGATHSDILGAAPGQQVGMVRFPGGPYRASLWTGTAGSYVDLHPPGATGMSHATGVDGDRQVGWATFDFSTHAGIWSGSGASWVDLHPSGQDFDSSWAYGAQGGQQVGKILYHSPDDDSFYEHASVWSGSAASWVSLHPIWAAQSAAHGVYNGQQVGWIEQQAGSPGQRRACLWTGSAESLVDLHPEGAWISEALAVHGGVQAGTVNIDGRQRASVWTGTAASWEDLSASLTGSWGTTYAWGVWTDGATIFVAGAGDNLETGRLEALLWTRPVPSPGAAVGLIMGGLAAAGGSRRAAPARRPRVQSAT